MGSRAPISKHLTENKRRAQHTCTPGHHTSSWTFPSRGPFTGPIRCREFNISSGLSSMELNIPFRCPCFCASQRPPSSSGRSSPPPSPHPPGVHLCALQAQVKRDLLGQAFPGLHHVRCCPSVWISRDRSCAFFWCSF